MDFLFILTFGFLIIIPSGQGQYSTEYPSSIFFPWPIKLLNCYNNLTNFDPSTRAAMTMENLIGLIRKYELSNSGSTNMAYVASMLIHRYRVDGMYYNEYADPSRGNMQVYPTGYDFQKTQMIKNMITQPNINFPTDIYTQAEECALFWMLSYNVNLTRSGPSESCTPPLYSYLSYNYKSYLGASPTTDSTKSMCPMEAGVVYTPWGTVAAGTVVAALAASTNLQPYYPNADNLWAASLGGDLAEYAVLEETLDKDLKPSIGTAGWWNKTALRRDYHLTTQIYSYLTSARIRGAIDGLVLGLKLRQWNVASNYPLSQVLDMYYSEMGMTRDATLRSCDRFTQFTNAVNDIDLTNQGLQFMIPLEQNYSAHVNPNANTNLMKDSIKNLRAFTNGFQVPDKEKCSHKVDSPGNMDPIYKPNIDLIAVMDFSTDDFTEQRTILASLAQNLDISPWSSRMAVVANSNNTYIMPFNYSYNGAEIAERIYDLNYQRSRSVKLLDTLNFLYDEIRNDEQRILRNNGGNTKVILIMATGQSYPSTDKRAIMHSILNFRWHLSETRIFFYTSKADYNDFVWDTKLEILSPNKYAGIADPGNEMAMTAFAKIPKRLDYPACNTLHKTYKPDEGSYSFIDNVSPLSVGLYAFHPINFYTSDSLSIYISAKSGSGLRVCTSRDNTSLAFEGLASKNCKEQKGTNNNIQFQFSNLCPNDDWTQCKAIYLTVQPLEMVGDNPCSSSVRKDLRISCRYPSQATFQVTHKGMECNRALQLLTTPAVLLITVLVSLLQFRY